MPLRLQIVGPDAAHERREFPRGRFDLFKVADQLLGRAAYEPGWRWSQHVGPGAGASWCEVEHVGFVLAGRAAVRMRDGTEVEMGAGDWFSVPAGHDSWVLGDEEYVSLHVLGAHSYAVPKPASTGHEPVRKRSPISAATVPPGADDRADRRAAQDQTADSHAPACPPGRFRSAASPAVRRMRVADRAAWRRDSSRGNSGSARMAIR